MMQDQAEGMGEVAEGTGEEVEDTGDVSDHIRATINFGDINS